MIDSIPPLKILSNKSRVLIQRDVATKKTSLRAKNERRKKVECFEFVLSILSESGSFHHNQHTLIQNRVLLPRASILPNSERSYSVF
jgi:hypothetical protein